MAVQWRSAGSLWRCEIVLHQPQVLRGRRAQRRDRIAREQLQLLSRLEAAVVHESRNTVHPRAEQHTVPCLAPFPCPRCPSAIRPAARRASGCRCSDDTRYRRDCAARPWARARRRKCIKQIAGSLARVRHRRKAGGRLRHRGPHTEPSTARAARDEIVLERRTLVAQIADKLGALDRGDDRNRAGMIGAIDEVLVAQRRAAWDHDRAGLERAHVGRLPERDARQRDHHRVARLDSEAHQHIGNTVGLLANVGEAQSARGCRPGPRTGSRGGPARRRSASMAAPKLKCSGISQRKSRYGFS